MEVKFDNINNYINVVTRLISKEDFVSKFEGAKKHLYLNIATSFDIETTSIKLSTCKNFAYMYIWQFDMYIDHIDFILYGRTWEEFIEFYNKLVIHLRFNDKKHMIIYCHNLAYEYQFICKRLNFVDVFAAKNRTPLRAETSEGIIFKCSYRLSGKSLAETAKDLTKYKCEKLELDYNKIRNSLTKLTDEEINYCVNDVVIVCHYIQEKIESDGNITKIPLTCTSYVRKYLFEHCNAKGKHSTFSSFIKGLTLNEEEFEIASSMKKGGFVQCNFRNVGLVHHDVVCMDFITSYIACCTLKEFPISKGKKVFIHSQEQFYYYLNKNCCIFKIVFKNLRIKEKSNNGIISLHKCEEISENFKDFNGRILSADYLQISLNNVDFENILHFYDFDSFIIKNDYIYTYEKGYLNKELIQCLIDFYKKKTELKNVEGREVEYQYYKNLLNSFFGNMIMDIHRDVFDFKEGNWTKSQNEISDDLETYNRSKKRTNSYLWGCYIVSLAQRNLFSGIIECKDDFIYSDTDSIYLTNYKKHEQYFSNYNKWITNEVHKCLEFYNFNVDSFEPENIYHQKQPLGIWAIDKYCKKFMCIKAKAYIYTTYTDNEIHTTIAGLPKKSGSEFFKNEAKRTHKTPFYIFSNDFVIPAEESGILVHSYIDNYECATITDYQGNTCFQEEYSFIHLSETTFSFCDFENMFDYLVNGIQTIEE